jgi:hypothetical protein
VKAKRQTIISPRQKTIIGLLVTILISVLLVIFLFQLWNFNLGVPYGNYGGDLFLNLTFFQNVLDTGFWAQSARLAALSNGVINVGHQFMLDNIHYAYAGLLVNILQNPFVAINIFFFSLFIWISSIAYLSLKSLNVKCIFAVPSAVLFAFSPYIFYRNTMHVWLSAYEFIPLAILLCVWVYSDERFLLPPPRGKIG